MKKIIYFFLFIFLSNASSAQLCQGSLGEAIVNNTFGAGANPGAPLIGATTAYQYRNSDCPGDGFYTVANSSIGCFNSTWHVIPKDHTGNPNGYFMLVNASIQPSAFFVDTVRGLCSNAVFEFASFIANVLKPNACGAVGIPPNITFTIEKTDGSIIQTYNSGNIIASNTLEWRQFGFFFTTPVGVTDIVLRLTNNATGGCGNDLAIDDITFKPCGPLVIPNIAGLPTNFGIVCQGVAKTFTFNTNTSAGYSNPTYQWQQSINGGLFIDIVGENTNSLVRIYPINNTIATYKYRVKVAEAGNLGSPLCSVFSAVITITIIKKPTTTISTQNALCQFSNIKIIATGGILYNWQGPNNYTNITDTVFITNAQPNNSGVYSVIINDTNGCQNTESINVTINPKPTISTLISDTTICFDTPILLSALSSDNINWLPLAYLNTSIGNTVAALPKDTTTYFAIATNNFGCADTAVTVVNVIKKPSISAGPDKFVIANTPTLLSGSIVGAFESFEWQPPLFINNITNITPTVNPPADITYTLKVITKNNCAVLTDTVNVKIYQGIFIPNSFSPNGDNKNDVWNIPALAAYPSHVLTLYNRYGQIIFSRKHTNEGWDGTFKNLPQPTGAYQYVIDLKNNTPLLKGSVLLVR